MAARFLTSFVLTGDGDNDIVVTINSVTETLTIPAGTYFWACDDDQTAGTLDFSRHLEETLETHSEAGQFDALVVGVNLNTASLADGRVRLQHRVTNQSFRLDFSDIGWELDPRILGFPADQASNETSTDEWAENSRHVLVSDFVHRYGWYPQQQAAEDMRRRLNVENTLESPAGYVNTVFWRSTSDISIRFAAVGAPLCRIDHGNSLHAAYNLEASDTNAPFETWVTDMVEDAAKVWRYYPDAGDYFTTSFWGPYRFPGGSTVRKDPLAPPSSPALGTAENWRIVVLGREAVG